jgi:hypothetical protein
LDQAENWILQKKTVKNSRFCTFERDFLNSIKEDKDAKVGRAYFGGSVLD